jgi:hypothetical protein
VIALWAAGGLAALLVVGWIVLKVYVGGPGRTAIAAQLSEAVGLPIEIESLDVGVGSSSAAVRIPDKTAGPTDDLLRIKSLTTDLSLTGFLSGHTTPTRITVSDVDILLRIDEKGQILSPLPTVKPTGKGNGPLPVVTVSGARVRIRQTGRPEFVLTGVSGELKRDGDGYAITGSTDDPNWGKWRIAGRLANDPADGRVELSTDRGPLSDSLIRTIPYVPPEVWDHLKVAGETPAAVRFTFKPGTDLGYAVELNPTSAAQITVPDADVTLTQVTGKILVADGKVTVSDGTVSVADGTVAVNGVYSFERPTAVITLDLAANRLDLGKLPAAWGLPKEIEGRLKGTAALELHVSPEGKLDTRGSGSGVVEGAKVAGLDAEITLRLVARDGRYQFDSGPRKD